MIRRTVVCLRSSDAVDHLKDELENAGWQFEPVRDVEAARALLDEQPHAVGLIEFSKQHLNGQATKLEWLLRCTPDTAWVGLTGGALLPGLCAHGLIPGFLFDYHTLPVDPPRLIHSLGHAYGMTRVQRATGVRDNAPAGAFGLIGRSPALVQVLRDIRKIALVDAPVMLSGESGTGKELAARAIHSQSARHSAPFMAVNCGAIPAELIQSVLFGHERGAFTGAHRRHIGRIEAAHGGTIFLDEIGDLPRDLQVNLLRFLQESTIERLGGSETLRVDVRVIAASHIDLQDAVHKGQFREDLYYRLNVLKLRMPPLRERELDIELLARHFFSVFAKERNRKLRGFSADALDAMRVYHWPGNVRELMNRIRRATVMCERSLITAADLDLAGVEPAATVRTLAAARSDAERRSIEAALYFCDNNISEAARRLGVARITLYRLLRKYQLDCADDPLLGMQASG